MIQLHSQMGLLLPFLLLHMSLHHGGAYLTMLPPERCASLDSSFHQYCTCSEASGDFCGGGEVELNCIKLPKFFVDSKANDSAVNCLMISNSPDLKTITVQGLQQFPNLNGLKIRGTGLSHITPGALDKLRNLVYLDLVDNKLTTFPYISNLTKLNTILVSRNLITSVDNRTFIGLPSLASLNLKHNRISILEGRIFATNCILSKLVLSNNPLRHIADEVFDKTRIGVLYLIDTSISLMPSPIHLRRALEYLYLKGSRNLKTFDFVTRTGNYSNKTFPFLREVSFPYHAHCCQLKKLAEMESRSGQTAHSISSNARKDKREVVSPDGSSVEVVTICVNRTSLVCLSKPLSEALSMNVSLFEDLSEFCSDAMQGLNCSTCMNNICPETCNSSSPTSGDLNAVSGNASADHSWDLACFSSITPTQTLSSASGDIPNSQSFSNSVPALPSSSVFNPALQSRYIPEPTSSSQYTVILPSLSEMVSLEHSPSPIVRLTATSTTVLVNHTICQTPATLSLSASHIITATPLSEMPTGDYFDPYLCRVNEVLAECVLTPPPPPPTNNTNSTSTPPTDTSPSNINCKTHCSTIDNQVYVELCTRCHVSYCKNQACQAAFPEFCSQCRSRKKRSLESESEEEEEYAYVYDMEKGSNVEVPRSRVRRADTFLLDLFKPFKATLPNFSEPFSCKRVFKNPEPDLDNGIPCNIIVDNSPLSESIDFVNVSCTPEEDSFNPCKSLLGESNGLHITIWFVIIFAFMGNGIVFFVFIGYSVIIRRTAQDMFAIHFMYFNLAMADFFMGIYLFIIAVVDADTRGEFYLTDITWRTSHGCGFAGFCAIMSTVVSVYILLVITVERTYTIYIVFERKKRTNLQVYIMMAVGWVCGVLVAMLPLLGVSDYNTVAICLPFNVEGKINLAYVVALLLYTGVGFIIIFVCYAIIFQQIHKSNKMSPSQVTNRQTADIKIAIRIFVLVFTNFICWFPIALLGLSAAFGKSLVPNLEFSRWAMVFIFPINACLNPFLYSITTRAFREHTILLLSKCGLCKRRALDIKNARAGITPSDLSKTSNPNSNTNGHIRQCLQRFSLTVQSSTINLLSQFHQNSSVMSQSSLESQQMANFHSQPQQDSSLRSSSRDDKTNSQRESSYFTSSGHILQSTGFNNESYICATTTEIAGDQPSASDEEAIPRNRFQTSDSLGAVPEEAQLVQINPMFEEGKEDEEMSKCDSEVMDAEEGKIVLSREVTADLSSSSSHYQINIRRSFSSNGGEVESNYSSTCYSRHTSL